MTDLKSLIELFENAPRLGALADDPEGSRYIQISDTLVGELLQELKAIQVYDEEVLGYHGRPEGSGKEEAG